MSRRGGPAAGGRRVATDEPGVGVGEAVAMHESGWRVLAGDPSLLLDPEPPHGVAAVVVPSRDLFADPPALAVRADVLAALGGPPSVRAGGLADWVDRLGDAGHAVERRPLVLPRRPRTAAALLHEGSGRFWLWRRRPAVHPLPHPRDVGWWPYPVLALGALHANAEPTRAERR